MHGNMPLVLCSFRNDFVLILLTYSHPSRETLLFGIVKKLRVIGKEIKQIATRITCPSGTQTNKKTGSHSLS